MFTNLAYFIDHITKEQFIPVALMVHCALSYAFFGYGLFFEKLDLKPTLFQKLGILAGAPIFFPMALVGWIMSMTDKPGDDSQREGLLMGFSGIYLWVFVNVLINGVYLL